MEAINFESKSNPIDVLSSMQLSSVFFTLGPIALILLVYTEILCSAVRAAAMAKSLSKKISANRLNASKASKKRGSSHVKEKEYASKATQ